MVKRLGGRLTGWYQGKKLRTRILLPLIFIICVGGGYYAAREEALRNADHLTVTITRLEDETGGRAGSTVYQQTFGHSLAADAEHLLNDEVYVYPWASGSSIRFGGSQPSPVPGWHYHLAFSWLGILVETADVSTDIGPERFSISALGLPDLRLRYPKALSPYNSSILVQLYQDSNGVIPPPPE